MVTSSPERKAHAEYSLSRVRALAAREAVRYVGTRVQLDVDALGYGLADVCACLMSLREADFAHSERYAIGGKWHDVFRVAWGLPGKRPDLLYLKLRLDDDVVVIELCSFHLSRPR